MKDYKKLSVWELAHGLAVNVYKATADFPKDEQYGLSSQIRRACVSIPSNISEGCGRSGDAELGRFLQIALGSANELEYQLLLAHDLQFVSHEVYNNLNDQVDHVRRMLISLIKKTRVTPEASSRPVSRVSRLAPSVDPSRVQRLAPSVDPSRVQRNK